jgi:hypothetical protein
MQSLPRHTLSPDTLSFSLGTSNSKRANKTLGQTWLGNPKGRSRVCRVTHQLFTAYSKYTIELDMDDLTASENVFKRCQISLV